MVRIIVAAARWRRLVGLSTASLALAACTTVTPEALTQQRGAGITQPFARPAEDLYTASLAALRAMQSTSDWHELRISTEDPARGTILAERRLESAVLPGVGVREAIGIFITSRPGGTSTVTVVAASSDQVPGEVGTTLQSRRAAHAYVFPAIEDALKRIPVGATNATQPADDGSPDSVERESVVADDRGSSTRSVPAPPPAPAPRAAEPLLDRVYETLRASEWRPLVRELREGGDEQIRIGQWARLTASGNRVAVTIRDAAGVAVNAARLALELEQAGFEVEIAEEASHGSAR